MFAHDWATRKRGREEEDFATPGFSEHRQKRRIATLPHRTSPNAQRRAFSSPFAADQVPQPAPPTITPADSDEEQNLTPQNQSVFSPWSSPTSPAYKMTDSQATSMSDVPMYSADMEMTDSVHLLPGPFTNDPSPSISGRIPTPIQSSFAPFVRSEKAPRNDPNFADDESMVERIRRGRRLPSPISEGETSPSVIVEAMGGMQMEVEPTLQTPPKKGHTRSKHSLRTWTGYGDDMGGNSMMNTKRTFSMGYRSDCEKCRLKVPGHFSHIITYD
ncbi:hypothetical protein BP6252_10120 [Coleophoma cylindrospora]|uniref:Uncharacterized protein n=1 Tax=Coleophoma cylindrospora TaxID=1849047 RepID=A0A3D8QXJ2_9HELO|nr:hypothetical protein BP6252_10120 [Coleophoma cylindrospora]